MPKPAQVKTIKDNNLSEFDKKYQDLINEGWSPDSDLVVVKSNDSLLFFRTLILYPIGVENNTTDLT